MNHRFTLPYEALLPTERNARRRCERLAALATSIAAHGLLQNLVVQKTARGWEVRAGERRRRAIGILLLPADEQLKQFGKVIGTWESEVPVLEYSGLDVDAAHLIENLEREDLWPWEIGRRLCEWNDGGIDQREIARRIGKSKTRVAAFCQFGRCLSPRVTEALERIGTPSEPAITLSQLEKLCRLYDGIMLEPLHDEQVALLEGMLGEPRKHRRVEHRSAVMRVYERAQRLRKIGKKCPGHAKPYIKAVLDFLYSEEPMTRPKFTWD